MGDARGDRIAEIAVALEGLPFVAGLYAPTRPEEAYFEVAVAMDPLDGRRIAEAHYAVMRTLGREVAARLLFFDGALAPGAIASEALVVSGETRSAARARIAARPRPLEPLPPDPPALTRSRRILLIDPLPLEAVAAHGTELHIDLVTGPLPIRSVAPVEQYDLILCPSERAHELPGDSRVVLRAPEAIVVQTREHTGTRTVARPITAATLHQLVAELAPLMPAGAGGMNAKGGADADADADAEAGAGAGAVADAKADADADAGAGAAERIAEVAVALEGLPFVHALYTPKLPDDFDVGVALDSSDGRRMMEAHYTVVRKVGRSAAARVYYFDGSGPFPGRLIPGELVLSPVERERARARLAERPPEPDPPSLPSPPRDPRTRRVLFLNAWAIDVAALESSQHDVLFKSEAFSVRHPLSMALIRDFDLVLCPAGIGRFAPRDRRVVLLAHAPWHARVAKKVGLRIVDRPISPQTLDALLADTPQIAPAAQPRAATGANAEGRAGPGVAGSSNLGATQNTAPGPRPIPRRAHILLLESTELDRTFASRALAPHFAVDAISDVWTLLELSPDSKWDLVLCDPTWRLPSGEPVRRFLARLRPDLSERTFLLASPPAPPHPRVLVRPVSREAIDVLLGRTAAHAR